MNPFPMRLPRPLFLITFLLAAAHPLHADKIATIVLNAAEYGGKADLAAVKVMAEKQSKKGTGLGHRSTKIENKTFTGKFTMPKVPSWRSSKQLYGMAIFSDDGCKVSVDGGRIHDKAGAGQTLEKLDQSFHELPILLAPEKEVSITVEYTNINYTGKRDIDGCTLFLFLVPLEANVEEVSFKVPKGREVISDDATQVFMAPHWVDKNGDGKPVDVAAGEHNYPVAFTRNTAPEIEAKIEVKSLPKGAVCKVRATGKDGVSIAAKAVPAGKQIKLPFTAAAKPWANTVKFYTTRPAGKSVTPFTPDWELSFTDGKSWHKIGKTEHTVYVNLADPKTALRQETLFEIGCRNANGKTTEADTVKNIWSEYTDRTVVRVQDNASLTYWSPTRPAPEPLCWQTAGLLALTDGRCGAWAEFFKDVLLIQGITSQVAEVDAPPIVDMVKLTADVNAFLPLATYNIQPLFFVKKWNLAGANPFNSGDLKGVAGQSNPDPRSIFDNHAIVLYNGKYYDPSYGTGPFASKVLWEDASLDGFGAYVINATTGALHVWRERVDPKKTLESKITP